MIPNPVMEGLPSAFVGERKNNRCRRKTAAAEKLWHAAESICTLSQEISGVQSGIYGKGEMLEELQKEAQRLQIDAAVVWERLPKGCPELYPFGRNVCFAVKL